MKEITQELKEQIGQAVKDYRADYKLSQDEVAHKAGINVSYVNSIEAGKSVIGKSPIGDKYYRKLADVLGIHIDKVFWKHEDTPQYLQLHTELYDAKVSGRVRVLIAKTRHGKTYTVNRFLKEVPKDTYRITVSSLYRLKDIVNELCDLLGCDVSGSYVSRMKRIAKVLNDKKLAGGHPNVIIDEAENMTVPVLRMCKALYDVVKDACSLTFVGTPQFILKIEAMKEKNVEGMPQFYARLKAGIRDVADILKERDFAPFLSLVEDENLRILLLNLADNYGELNDYLEYALKEADRMGVELNEKLFKQLFSL